MGQLCIYLPPFAADYSGAASALFDLDCMIAINDAGCCTSHYVYYDEPRWEEKVKPLFCTTIRSIDAIYGNDDKIISEICRAGGELDTAMTAVIGTPVPALTGMDMQGIAAEIEYRTGKPAFGFDTTGFSYYDKGIFRAGKALIDRFASPGDIIPGSVNIVGLTPLDHGNCGNAEALIKLLEGCGIRVISSMFMGLTEEGLKKCSCAELNLAVSEAGLELCRYLESRFQTPYICGIPVGRKQGRAWLERIGQRLNIITAEPTGESGADSIIASAAGELSGSGGRLLIIGDQIIGNSLREAVRLEAEDMSADIRVASFFGFDRSIAEGADLRFKEEADYLKYLKEEPVFALLADPFIMDVPQAKALKKISFVHPAVSSCLKWDDCIKYVPEI